MPEPQDEGALREVLARFPPLRLGADLDALPPAERACVDKLVAVCRIMDTLYLRQLWARNADVLLALARDDTAAGRARRELFMLNRGPWNRTGGDEPFIDGVPARPPQCNYYPAGATREEVEAWLESLP